MRTIIAFFLMLFSCIVYSQTPDNSIYLSVHVPERKDITLEAAKQLEVKLSQLVSQHGVMDTDQNNKFVVTSKASVVTKDIVAGPPAMVSMNIDFTFMIGDAEENKVFETCKVSTIGVGQNENKAFISAVKSIKTKSKELVDFITKAKEKIITYYDTKYEHIKTQAISLFNSNEYERGLYKLIQIPEQCSKYEECQQLIYEYMIKYNDYKAKELLLQARMKWAASPNATGASSIVSILESIPANSACQNEVDELVKEMEQKLKDDEDREWKFRLKQYNDYIDKQKRDDQARLEQQRADNKYRAEQQSADNRIREIQQRADNEARRQSIESLRQIGIEWAKNQPKEVKYTQNVILW